MSKWELFAAKLSKAAFLADKPVFALYLQQLKDETTSKGTKGFAVAVTVYAVDYAHSPRRLELPGKYEAARLLCCSTRRSLARPVIEKNEVVSMRVLMCLTLMISTWILLEQLCCCIGILEARYDDLVIQL